MTNDKNDKEEERRKKLQEQSRARPEVEGKIPAPKDPEGTVGESEAARKHVVDPRTPGAAGPKPGVTGSIDPMGGFGSG
jgi:hypothetical protein